MRRWRFDHAAVTGGAPVPGDRRRSERGDTLVEILITLTVIGIGATAILLAFATSISGSGQERTAATLDSMLRTAAAEVTSDMQQQSSTIFASCSGAYTVNTTAGSIPLPNAPAPAPQYTATIVGAQYWQTSGASPYSFTTPPAAPTNTGCPANVGTSPPGPQQLTIQVSGGGRSESITTVVQDPVAPPGGATCVPALPASKLVWVDQPSDGNAASVLYPAPTIALEDSNNCVVQTDASTVQLAIATGPSGATLNNCVHNVGYGETTFQNCNLGTPGTYTLSVTDPTTASIHRC